MFICTRHPSGGFTRPDHRDRLVSQGRFCTSRPTASPQGAFNFSQAMLALTFATREVHLLMQDFPNLSGAAPSANPFALSYKSMCIFANLFQALRPLKDGVGVLTSHSPGSVIPWTLHVMTVEISRPMHGNVAMKGL